ncbi:hypothetical protein NKG05_29090 [Oerskovia sp. M15]
MTGGSVVILGPTGATSARACPGTAYVLDLRLAALNTSAVATREVLLDPLDDADAVHVEALVRTHLEETGSPIAAELLEDFDAARGRFTRILPPSSPACARRSRRRSSTGSTLRPRCVGPDLGGGTWLIPADS